MNNIFEPLKDYENHYEINRNGVVRSINRIIIDSIGKSRKLKGKLLTHIMSNKYPAVCIRRNNKQRIHRLLAVQFIPNPNNYSMVLHKDDDKLNYNLDNLYWGTHKDNSNDRLKNDKLPNLKFSKEELKEIINLLKDQPNTIETYKRIGDKYNVSVSCICNINKYKSKRLNYGT